jgi:exosortase A-associated hydrolase 2
VTDRLEPALPFYLPVGSRSIFCLHYTGCEPARGAVVYVPPFAEEMNKSRRMAAMQARVLAAAGWHVLQFDLSGTGDSEGDFADASWTGWLEDVAAARSWLAQRTGFSPWLWGLRLGGLLATVSLKQFGAPGLVLWQPVLSGRQHLQQFLRLKSGSEWLAAGREAEVQAKPMEQLQSGISVEVAGYMVSPALALPMAAAMMELPHELPRLGWFEVSPREEAGLAPASLRVMGPRQGASGVRVAAIKGSSFWQAVEIETVPELITATCMVFDE